MRRYLVVLISIIIMSVSANAARDEKFFKKAAEFVWGMNVPQFDPKTHIPDSSLYNNESAVIIAVYDLVGVKHVEQTNISKYRTTGRAYTNATEAKIVHRCMVKLMDQNAVEKFSEFDISAKQSSAINSYSYQYSNSAFGARVHKADGSIIEVDCSDAYTVTQGKGRKEEEVEHKVAIPGLEPGDVLEYFVYDEQWVDEKDLAPMIFPFAYAHPVMYFKIECQVDPILTIEYRTLNGAPLLMGSVMKDGTRVLEVETINLTKAESGNWLAPNRQQPMIKMYILNNNSTMVYHPKSARRGGVFCNLPPVRYYDDISHVLHDLVLPKRVASRATKIANKYIEANPNLNQRQIIDAAWLATIYSALIDEDSHDQMNLSIFFADVLKKLKVKPMVGIGVINSRAKSPITEILSWKEPTYMNMVGDSCYIYTNDLCFQPGEYIGDFEGEKAAVLWGDRDDFVNISAVEATLPTSRANQNTFRSQINVSFNPDDNTILNLQRSVNFTGANKEFASALIDRGRYLRELEAFLGIPEKDQYELKSDSVKIKEVTEKNFRTEAKTILGVEPREIYSYEIKEIGALPGSPNLSYTTNCDVDNLVKKAGRDIIVEVGKLFGKPYEVKGTERERKEAVVRNTPSQNRYTLSLEIPEGYTVNDASLQKINTNIANECGAFYAQARVAENKLVVQVNERYLQYVVPIERWSKFLELIDASVAFSNASIVLNKVN